MPTDGYAVQQQILFTMDPTVTVHFCNHFHSPSTLDAGITLMVNAAPSNMEISYPVTYPSFLKELSSCSLVEPFSLSLLEHHLLVESTTVATQTDYIKKISFSNYLQKAQSRSTHTDSFGWWPIFLIYFSMKVYIVKLGIRAGFEYCLWSCVSQVALVTAM